MHSVMVGIRLFESLVGLVSNHDDGMDAYGVFFDILVV